MPQSHDASRSEPHASAEQPTGGPPGDLRNGVRSAVLESLRRDFDLRAGPTARRLAAAGVSGVIGTFGATLLLGGHPFGHHPSWHMLIFGIVWAGLLVTASAALLLGIRTPRLPVADAVKIAVLSLGIAGVCSLLCPDRHFLYWWQTTRIGAGLAAAGGPAVSALCFGLVTTGVFAALAAWVAGAERTHAGIALAAATTFVLLAPGVLLQSVGSPGVVAIAWLAATAAGAAVGVWAGLAVRHGRLRLRA